MNSALNGNLFLVKEHVGFFKAANAYDIYDPKTGKMVLQCIEEKLGFFTKLLRFTDYKRATPFDLQIRTPEGRPVLRVTRGVCLFLSKVKVLDENDRHIGGFKQKLFTIGGAFRVLDEKDQVLCELRGKWTGWDFRFASENKEYARVNKKWAGIGKEFFTSADNYVLEITEAVPQDHSLRQLILSAVMCIDLVLKE